MEIDVDGAVLYGARIERNFIINPAHPEASAIIRDLPEPVWWDARLYG